MNLLKTIAEENMLKNIEIAKGVGLENISDLSAIRHNKTIFAQSIPLSEREFKYNCGIIVDTSSKKIYNGADFNADEAKRVIAVLSAQGYKY